MRMSFRNKRKLYLCNVYEEDGKKKYSEPIELYENWQVTSTEADFMNLGLELFNYVRIKTTAEHAHYYHVGDRVYLFTKPPIINPEDNENIEGNEQEQKTYDEFCMTADYQVYKDPIVTFNECTIWLQKLSGRNSNSIY